MRTLIICLAGLALIVLGAYASLLIYFDEARLKVMAAEQVRQQTGRELHLDGPLDLRLFPRLALDARQVRLSGPPDYDGPELFEADRFRMSLRLLPLIRGRIEAGEIELAEAELRLHTDRGGRSSLEGLVGGREHDPDVPATAPALTTEAIRLSRVSILATDAVTGRSERYEVDELEIDGFAFDRDVPFRFRGSVGDPPRLEDLDASGRLRIAAGGGPVRVSGLQVRGQMAGIGIGLNGDAVVDPGPPLTAELVGGRLLLDGESFDLELAYRDAGRPMTTASLAGSSLDLDALLDKLGPAEGQSGGNEVAGESPLLVFRDMDLDGRLALERLRVSGLDLSGVSARARASDGVLRLDPLAGSLDGGRMEATATVDLNREPPRVELRPRFDLDSLSEALAPWGLDRHLSGAGRLSLDLSGAGLDSSALLGSLSGTGSYGFRDGRVNGLDLDAMVQGLRARDLAAAARSGAGGSTAFREMEGSIRVDDGQLTLPDLELATERLGVQGEVRLGLADLALGGELRLSGEGLDRIPVALGGSLLEPRLRPDLGRALQEEAGRRVLDLIDRRRGREGEAPEEDPEEDPEDEPQQEPGA